MLSGGAVEVTGGEASCADDAACTGGCGSAREDTGTLCCETAACPRLARVDARLGGGGESSLSPLSIGLVRRLLRSLLPMVSILSFASDLKFSEEKEGEGEAALGESYEAARWQRVSISLGNREPATIRHVVLYAGQTQLLSAGEPVST